MWWANARLFYWLKTKNNAEINVVSKTDRNY